jgi:potassium-dependent mechanosensitive channel
MTDKIALIARLLAVVAACALAMTAAGFAQQPVGQPPSAQPPAQPSPAQPPAGQPPQQTALAELEPMKLALDQIEATLRREELPIGTLRDLEASLAPVRDDLRGKLADLQGRLAKLDDARKKLGPAPAADAPAESPTIAAERTRLNQAYSDVDAAAKQANLLSSRADALADRIGQRQRDLFTQRLLQRTPSVLDPSFWADTAKQVPGEIHSMGVVLQSWGSYARDNGGLPRIGAAAATLLALGVVVALLVRLWRRRFGGRPRSDTRSANALASLLAFARGVLTMPLIVTGVVQVLDAFALVPPRIDDITTGLVIAVVIAAFGRGVADGTLAPHAPRRRLTRFDDATARSLFAHMTWGSRALGAAVFLIALHRAIASSPILAVATDMLLALVILGLLLHVLFELRQPAEEPETDAAPRRLWVRALAWLIVVGIVASLVGGYADLAFFLAVRALATVAIVGAFYLLIAASDALLLDFAAADTPRRRAIAINFGLNPRNVGLIATLIAGAVRVLLTVVALVLLVGPWQVSTTSLLEWLRGATSGFEVAGITFSFATLLGAAAVLIVILVVTRTVQRWLERQLFPRTDLDPSLQLSIVTIFGYLGMIGAIAFALAQLGIDLQKIALIAGALSVGIGFGLQAIVSNFISGLILLAERPIRVGDQIVVKDQEGIVSRISVRATEIQTGDQGTVIVPNSELITGLVKNRTHANTWGQIVIKVGVGYDSNPEQVRDILMACAKEHKQVVQSPAPSVQLASLGDNALQFEVYAVIANLGSAGPIKSDIHFAILTRFREAGIRIAYPQREVRLLGEEPPAKRG